MPDQAMLLIPGCRQGFQNQQDTSESKMVGCFKTFLFYEFSCLSFGEPAQHYDGVEKHYNVSAKHFPNIKEDSFKANVIETSSRERINLKAILAVFLLTHINNVLLHIQTIFVRNLKLETNSSRGDYYCIFRNLQNVFT